MNARYTHAEFRATMLLKQITIIDLAKKLHVSRRIVDYFIKGEKEMSKSEEFIEILRPELDSVQRINRRMLRKSEENMGNQSIGKKKMDKIIQEIGGALDPITSGRIIWLGNLVHPNYAICQYEQDLKDEIKSENDLFNPDDVQHFFTKAKILLRFPLEDQNGISVWEDQYPTSELLILRQKFGLTGYLREFLGKPVIEGNIFKNHWV